MDAVGCLISTERMANERKKMTILQEKSKVSQKILWWMHFPVEASYRDSVYEHKLQASLQHVTKATLLLHSWHSVNI